MGLTFDFVYNGEALATSNELPQASNKKANISHVGYIAVAGEKDFQEKIKQAFKKLVESKTARRQLNEIFEKLNKEANKKTNLNKDRVGILIYPSNISDVNESNPYIIRITHPHPETFTPNNGRNDGKNLVAPLPIILAHELEHVRQRLNPSQSGGMRMRCLDKEPKYGDYFTTIEYSEVVAVEYENLVRADFNLPLRTHYGGVEVYIDNGKISKNKNCDTSLYDKGYIFGQLIKDKGFKRITREEYNAANKTSEDLKGEDAPKPIMMLAPVDKKYVTLTGSDLLKLDYIEGQMAYVVSKMISNTEDKNKKQTMYVNKGTKITIIKPI